MTADRATPPIYLDGDACPVKDETYRVAARYGLTVHVVANSVLNLPREPWIVRVVVGSELDAADDWIAARASPGSIVLSRRPARRTLREGGRDGPRLHRQAVQRGVDRHGARNA